MGVLCYIRNREKGRVKEDIRPKRSKETEGLPLMVFDDGDRDALGSI